LERKYGKSFNWCYQEWEGLTDRTLLVFGKRSSKCELSGKNVLTLYQTIRPITCKAGRKAPLGMENLEAEREGGTGISRIVLSINIKKRKGSDWGPFPKIQTRYSNLGQAQGG